MNLAVFDIDGTLTNTQAVDDECFCRTFGLEFDLPGLDADWRGYTHQTDSGIIDEAFRRCLDREPTDSEIRLFIDRFSGLLTRAAQGRPERFSAVSGAGRVLDLLDERPEWTVALATGGWGATSRIKLATAGLDIGSAPLASADDGLSRAQIVSRAVVLAGERYLPPGGQFNRVVSIGDGTWDVDCARELGLAFIGVWNGHGPDGGSRAADLQAEGARWMIPDYSDPGLFLDLLDRAGVPVQQAVEKQYSGSGSRRELAEERSI